MNIDLKQLSYYQTGTSAQYFSAPRTMQELKNSVKKIHTDYKHNYFYLGAGSNSLISDLEYSGAVLSLDKFDFIVKESDTNVRMGAGVTNKRASEFFLDQGLRGAEWMYGLPGQIGGTTRMNARCYGGEISQVVESVVAVNASGESEVFKNTTDVFRGYKDTYFMDHPEICIAEVVFKLVPNSDKVKMNDEMQSCFSDRLKKNQFKFPSCGCVFKNDYSVGVPAGMLIEACGLKGEKNGNAQINPLHANFIFNLGGASSHSVLELSFLMRESVYKKFGVWLSYEMECLGDFSSEEKRKLNLVRSNDLKNNELHELRDTFSKKV